MCSIKEGGMPASPYICRNFFQLDQIAEDSGQQEQLIAQETPIQGTSEMSAK
ncbi:hypothetical protein D3C78_1958080 [compost metagenome]